MLRRQVLGLTPSSQTLQLRVSWSRWLCLALVVFFSAAISAAENLVLKGGRILTMDPNQAEADIALVSDGEFRFVGSARDIDPALLEGAKVIDLEGRMAMPALHDAHIHPVKGGLKALYECNFPFSATPEEIASTVEACVAAQPDALWIRGGQWDSGFFDRFSIPSPRAFLDAVSGDAAVLLSDDSNHNGWANSKALELLGISPDTPDPVDGKILRDADGVPNGILLEGAEQAAYDQLPGWTESQFLEATREAVRIANGFGVVGLKDANALPAYVRAYDALAKAGDLSVYVATALHTPYGGREEALDLVDLRQLREQYASDRVRTNFVKIFLDGVPTASRTAAMLAPYKPDDSGHVHRGSLHLTPERLKQDLIELDAAGFTVRIHAAGDRSVRVALDAIEAARKANAESTARHEIAHAGYIDPADLGRFRSLSAVADLSPYLWHPSSIIDSIVTALGKERGERYWPIRDLLDAEASVLAGSDWPAAVETMDPWLGIEAMVTRRHPNGDRNGELWPEQAVRVQEALRIMTLDGARAIGVDSTTGSITEGKSADFIVLDRDLLTVPPAAISDTVVEATYFQGRRL